MVPASPLLPAYRRLLAAAEPLPAHLIARLLTDLQAEDAPLDAVALLVARPELPTADADALTRREVRGASGISQTVAAAYLTREQLHSDTADTAAAALRFEENARAAATRIRTATACTALLRHHNDTDVLINLAANDHLDGHDRLAALRALDDGRGYSHDRQRQTLRALPAPLRAAGARTISCWWLLEDLTREPLDDPYAATTAARVLLRRANDSAGNGHLAESAADTLHRIAGYLPAGPAAAALAADVATAAAAFTPVARVRLVLALTAHPAGPRALADRIGPLPWRVVLTAVDDETVWAEVGAELTALLTDPRTGPTLATLTGELDGTVADVLTAVAGVTTAS